MSLASSYEITDLIRKLRQGLGLSQEKLAAKLGVSLRTVNRWENGHAVPSALALKQVEGLLQQMSLSSKATVRDSGNDLLAQYFQE